MVASARLAAGLSGLRNRNARVTNKTLLHIVRGSIEGDPIILDDDDDEKNRILASQGVDEEDANEHHLQAALFASSQRTLSTSPIKPSHRTNDTSAFIPTPDATGLVAEYETLYPPAKYKEPATHLRFSDTLDECYVGGLSGAFTYFLDERDAEWLERHNGAARGEGTSASANGASNLNANNAYGSMRGPPRSTHARSAKAKGKEPECSPLQNGTQSVCMVIEEDHFELVMGLFEKWTDEAVSPYLHLASDPEHFPHFADYEKYLSVPLSPATFANFTVPENVPPPMEIIRLARAIYPWWKERRMEREGRRIVPQLHVLIIEAQEKEDKTGGSPYVCFRKRDVKPMRKTRTNNVTHTEKLTRLRGELQSSLELAQMVLQRERLKSQCVVAAEDVWRNRESLAEYMKRLNTAAPGSVPPGDESLLFDRERKRPPRPSKPETTATGRIILAANRRASHTRGGLSESLDPHSPLTFNGDSSQAFELCQAWPSARSAGIQREVDRELVKARKDDVYWEDLVDMPHQVMPASSAEKSFKALSSLSHDTIPIPPSPASTREGHLTSHPSRVARSIRLRTGRGGRMHLDRRLHIPRPHRLLQREWAGYPSHTADHGAGQEEAQRWVSRSWRPRPRAEEDVRLGRRERELGEDYWAHTSIYDQSDEAVVELVKATPPMERQDPTIGFEQSGYGWDGHVVMPGSRGLWARGRTGRDEDGWKPTPFLAVDPESLGIEVATRNAAERERMVEAWRGRTVDNTSNSGDGGALALFMDGGVAGGANEQMDDTREELDDEHEELGRSGHNADMTERAWRLDERWRYDSDSGLSGQDVEDRFLLDDYQAKFLRTTITLLDGQDHDTIKTDPQFLDPPAPKQNRYLDHQLRLQHPGLPQPSASPTPMVTSKPPLPHQIHPPLRSVPSPSHTNGFRSQGAPSSSVPLALSPPLNLLNHVYGTNPPSQSLSPSKTSGTNALGLIPGGARLPPDSAGSVRVSTPARTKHASSMPHPQAGLSGAFTIGMSNDSTKGSGETTLLNGALPHVSQQYPSLKSALGRVITAQQDTSMQYPGRSYQVPVSNVTNGVNGSDTTALNLPLGVGNLQLKLPPQRAAQARGNGIGENHSDSASTAEHLASDRFALALPRLPSAGTRTT